MDKEKRLNIKITDELASLPAFGRFYSRYQSTTAYSSKRSQLNNIFQAGALIVESELQGVFSFLDAGAFAAASVPEKQRMILDALAMRIGSTGLTHSPIPAAPPAAEISVKEPERAAEPEATSKQAPETVAQPEVAPVEPTDSGEPPAIQDESPESLANKERFKTFRPG